MKKLWTSMALLLATVAVIIGLSSCNNHVHNFNAEGDAYYYNCESCGEVKYICECGEYYYAYVDPLGHTPGEVTYEDVYEPSCTSWGYCYAVK